jgi:hypothetical protein
MGKKKKNSIHMLMTTFHNYFGCCYCVVHDFANLKLVENLGAPQNLFFWLGYEAYLF